MGCKQFSRPSRGASPKEMEWDTVIIATVGIVGTVSAAAVSPFAAARLARRDRRSDLYAETLASLWSVQDYAQTLSAVPGAQLDTPPFDRLRHLEAEVRLLGGPLVREQLRVVIQLANRFERELFLPQLRARALAAEQQRNPEAPADTAGGIQERLALGEIADELSRAIAVVEDGMRVEVT